MWMVEWLLAGSPLSASTSAGKPLYSQFRLETLADCEKTVTQLLGEWAAMAHAHSLVRSYSRYLSAEAARPEEVCAVQKYDYRSIVLEYGPAAVYSASVTWNPEKSAFNMAFGSSSSATGVNPHCMMRTQLEIQLNKERNLALLGKILTETWCPVKSLSRLPTTPHKWMSTNSQQRNTAIQVT